MDPRVRFSLLCCSFLFYGTTIQNCTCARVFGCLPILHPRNGWCPTRKHFSVPEIPVAAPHRRAVNQPRGNYCVFPVLG
ncbi:hypothetical protein HOY82DRAFT_546938 [Tuber indicum]|nr:hypothetical protein HOY82DRAFT_546938 [Tuber indicum]